MGTLLIFTLKASVYLSLFFIFYRIFLSKETFYRFNRAILVGLLLLSFILPFCDMDLFRETTLQKVEEDTTLLLTPQPQTVRLVSPGSSVNNNYPGVASLFLIYITGIIGIGIKRFISITQLIRLCNRGKRIKEPDGTTLIIHDQNISPFSWLKYIVISKKDRDKQKIILHEKAHIRFCHSADLFFTQFIEILLWYNPFSWLFCRELQRIHEFEADREVLRQGEDVSQYQLLLIEKAVGAHRFALANNFKQSKLKTRIQMMTKKKSNPWSRLKVLFVLPLSVIALSVFARPEIKNELTRISETKISGFSLSPSSPNKEPVTKKTEKAEGNKPAEETLYVTGEKIENANHNDTAAVKVIGYSTIKKGSRILDIEKNQSVIKIRSGNGKNPLFIVDGKPVDEKKLKKIDPDQIETVSVIKESKDTRSIFDDYRKKYGKDVKNGIVLITLKKVENRPLFILNGKVISESEFKAIDPVEIKSIQVLKQKDEKVPESMNLFDKYGERAKCGIVLITK